MATIFPFPKAQQRVGASRRKRHGHSSATVRAFPLVRHARIVGAIADEMRASRVAEDVLIGHLEIECRRLERAGVADAEIERVCREFAGTAWAAALRCDDDSHGAA